MTIFAVIDIIGTNNKTYKKVKRGGTMTKEELNVLIGQNVRRERKARDMSIEELARVMDFSVSFIGLMERGQRGVMTHNVYKLAKIFGVSVKKFFEAFPQGGAVVPETAQGLKQKQSKLASLTYNLSETEIDFIISTIKKLKSFR